MEEIMGGSWAFKMTETNLMKSCLICGSKNNIEMHHLRTIKDVVAKWRSGNITFEQWKGAALRKQVPLCSYHHDQYHHGKLNYADIKTIMTFTKLPNETNL
jgi:hypothetical protein